MMKVVSTISIALALMGAAPCAANAQWTKLTVPQDLYPSTALLLTDGRVFCQSYDGTQWWALTPDEFGSYVNGTWKTLGTPMTKPRLFYASAVLADGRVVVAGGEDSGSILGAELTSGEMFDGSTWTLFAGPPGWTRVGDAPGAVLPNGKLMIGSNNSPRTAILDEATLSWTASANKENVNSSEETWTLLPDGSVLTADCNGHPFSQYYVGGMGWLNGGTTTENGGGDLVEPSSSEIGPAVLMPNKQVVAFGATGSNHLFDTSTFLWEPTLSLPSVTVHEPTSTGPLVTLQLGFKDAPAVLLPGGSVLCAAGPVDGVSGHYYGPTYWVEYSAPLHGFSAVISPASAHPYAAPYQWRLLILPTGEALATNGWEAYVFDSPQTYSSSWQPTITSCPTTMDQGSTYTIKGTQFNGLSQCSSYGDDCQNATNYPIVRVRNNATGHIKYLRTHNHSTMNVATGATIVSTEVTVPLSTEGGDSQLWVVANGIPSKPFGVKIVGPSGG